MTRSIAPLMALVVGIAGCAPDHAEGGEAEPHAGDAIVVDSVVPMARALERFRVETGGVPRERLRGGASSPDELLAEMLRLLAARDTAALEKLALDRAEFAYLYFEESPLAQPPYELPPELAWFRTQQENRTGLLRLLRELGGRELEDAALICDQPPIEEGQNRIWSACRVRAGGREMRLFGAFVERSGRFKVLTYANDF